MREEMKTPVPPVDQALLAQTLEAARSTLSTESFGVAWSQGKLPLERVITIVLSNDLTP
jgi:hypothetical protein